MQLENSTVRSGTTKRFPRNAPPPSEPSPAHEARMRDLEELATMACDANEQLERELADAREQVGALRRLLVTLEESAESAESTESAATAQLERELAAARDQVATLQRLVVALEESAESADAPPARARAEHAFVTPAPTPRPVVAPQPFSTSDSADEDEEVLLVAPKRGPRSPWLYIAGALVAGGALAALMSPGQHASPPPPIVLTAPVAPPPAPPAPAPAAPAVAAPAVAKAEPVAPPAVTIPLAKPAAKPARVRTASAHRTTKRNRHVAKRKVAGAPPKETAKRIVTSNDPLDGLKM